MREVSRQQRPRLGQGSPRRLLAESSTRSCPPARRCRRTCCSATRSPTGARRPATSRTTSTCGGGRCRRRRMHTTSTSWEISERTLVELYLIWLSHRRPRHDRRDRPPLALHALRAHGGAPRRRRDRTMTTIPIEALKAKKADGFTREPRAATRTSRKSLPNSSAPARSSCRRSTGDTVEVPTKYGRPKKIQKAHLWHHKSCGQCGHIPGYSTSIFWVMRKLGYDYHDPKDQTSCTAWNYYASATSNAAAQAAVAVRNFAAANETGYFPLIHCGTSYGHYKEVRHELLAHPELRAEVRKIMEKLGKQLVLPEEIVHYSEWFYAMRHEIAAAAGARHVEHRGDRAPGVPLLQARRGRRDLRPGRLRRAAHRRGDRARGGARRGGPRLLDVVRLLRFRFPAHPGAARLHPVVRHAAQDRADEGGGRPRRRAHPRHRVRDDAGQEPVRRAGTRPQRRVSPCCPRRSSPPWPWAHTRTRSCQLHWHSANYKPMLEKMGIDHEQAWAEFQEDLGRLERGEKKYLDWDDMD